MDCHEVWRSSIDLEEKEGSEEEQELGELLGKTAYMSLLPSIDDSGESGGPSGFSGGTTSLDITVYWRDGTGRTMECEEYKCFRLFGLNEKLTINHKRK